MLTMQSVKDNIMTLTERYTTRGEVQPTQDEI